MQHCLLVRVLGQHVIWFHTVLQRVRSTSLPLRRSSFQILHGHPASSSGHATAHAKTPSTKAPTSAASLEPRKSKRSAETILTEQSIRNGHACNTGQRKISSQSGRHLCTRAAAGPTRHSRAARTRRRRTAAPRVHSTLQSEAVKVKEFHMQDPSSCARHLCTIHQHSTTAEKRTARRAEPTGSSGGASAGGVAS